MKHIILFLIFTFFFFCINGCYTPSQNLMEGSSLLVKAFDTSEKEYRDVREKFTLYMEKKDEESLNNYFEVEGKFFRGFKSIGIAIKAENELIQILGE